MACNIFRQLVLSPIDDLILLAFGEVSEVSFATNRERLEIEDPLFLVNRKSPSLILSALSVALIIAFCFFGEAPQSPGFLRHLFHSIIDRQTQRVVTSFLCLASVIILFLQ